MSNLEYFREIPLVFNLRQLNALQLKERNPIKEDNCNKYQSKLYSAICTN